MNIELTLPDMTCGHCARTVTSTVQKLNATAQVQIDLPNHKMIIQTNQPTETMKQTLANENYPAT